MNMTRPKHISTLLQYCILLVVILIGGLVAGQVGTHFRLFVGKESSGGVVVGETNAETWKRCMLSCKSAGDCAAFCYRPNAAPQCSLYANKEQDPKDGGTDMMYGVVLNREGVPSQQQPETTTSTNTSEAHIYIFPGRVDNTGGYKQDIIDFNPKTKSFTILDTQTQYAAGWRQVAVLGQKVIVEGGSSDEPSFEVFDTATKITFTTNVVSVKRFEGCGGVANDKFYTCFGDGSPDVGTNCDVYDLNNNYARTTLDMQILSQMTQIAYVFKDDYVYTVGGYNSKATGGKLDRFLRHSLSDGMVYPMPNYPIAVVYATAVLYQGNVVVCGGVNTSSIVVNDCGLYNFTSAQWQSFANLVTPVKYHSCVTWEPDKILCMGGDTGLGDTDTVQLYESGMWSEYANLPYEMYALAAVIVGG